jgi:hypothetical protein
MSTASFPRPKGAPSKTKVVEIEAQSLCIHPRAQRALVPRKLKKLVREFDLDAVGSIHAVQYEIDGTVAIWIIDGQHRWRALMDLGLGEWKIKVVIHLDVTTDARAHALFLKLNDRTAVSSFDKFMNGLGAGCPTEVGVERIAREHAFKITSQTADGCLACVAVLCRLYETNDGEALAATLDTIITAWGRTAAACEGKVIEGLGMVYEYYSDSIDRPALIKKLAKYPSGPSRLLGDARGLRELRKLTLPRCVAERIIDTYNSGRRVGKLNPL